MAKGKNYQEWLLEKLKNHNEAIAYLTAASEESLKGDEESQHLVLNAIRNVMEAQIDKEKKKNSSHKNLSQ